MNFHAYKITCLPTNEVYIGITTQGIEKRWSQHKSPSATNTKLSRCVRKYGADFFVVEHIASSWDLASLSLLEAELIKQYNSVETGLNVLPFSGGYGAVDFNNTARASMSASRKTIWQSTEYREKITASQKAAWARKSPTEISERKERARRLLTGTRRPRPRCAPLPYKGKGWNMKIKTHCPQGHEYSRDNTHIHQNRRICKTCKRQTRNAARNRRVAVEREHRLAEGGKRY